MTPTSATLTQAHYNLRVAAPELADQIDEAMSIAFEVGRASREEPAKR
jgi:hypothetical protein